MPPKKAITDNIQEETEDKTVIPDETLQKIVDKITESFAEKFSKLEEAIEDVKKQAQASVQPTPASNRALRSKYNPSFIDQPPGTVILGQPQPLDSAIIQADLASGGTLQPACAMDPASAQPAASVNNIPTTSQTDAVSSMNSGHIHRQMPSIWVSPQRQSASA